MSDILFDPDQVQKALKKYYRKKLQGKIRIEVSHVRRIEQGMANNMYSFRLGYIDGGKKYDEDLMLRMNSNKELKLREFQALEKLNSAPIPVPKVYDAGEDMLGCGFIIMEKVEGQDMWNGAMDGMTEAEKAELWKHFSQSLADIHMLDWRAAGFGFLNPPEGEYGYIDRWLYELRSWSGSMDAHELTPVLDWMEENKPPSDHYVLLHGDYYPNNVLVHEGRITAIIDWDGVSIGDPAYDVCEIPFVLRTSDPSGEWSDGLAESFLEHYQEITGRELRNLDFYLALKSFFFLLVFLQHTTVNREWRETVLGSCIRTIEEKTGIKVSLPQA